VIDDSLSVLAPRLVALSRTRPAATVVDRVVHSVRRLFLPELRLESTALTALMAALRSHDGKASLAGVLEAASVELDRNLRACEAHAAAGRAVGLARIDALARTHRLLIRTAAIDAAGDARARALTARTLAYAHADMRATPVAPSIDGAAGAATSTDETRAQQRRDLEIKLCESLVRAALDETSVPARRRRLLEATKRSLLDLEAADPTTRPRVQPMRTTVAREIIRIDRARAAGIDERVTLTHQARAAHSRRDADALAATLSTILNHAATADRKSVLRASGKALAFLRRNAGTDMRAVRAESETRSFGEMYGRAALDALREAYTVTPAKVTNDKTAAMGVPQVKDRELDRMIHTMLGVTGTLEIGSGDRIAAIETEVERVRVVRHPEQTMFVAPAESVEELPNAFIDDPRMVLHDLASGRLLARRFARLETVRSTKPTRTAEARFFLLDGSTSMLNDALKTRAKVRDALLLTELAEVIRQHAGERSRSRFVLYYRYFSSKVGSIVRVADAASAALAMRRIVTEEQNGGTDIELALLQCFADVRKAVDDDPQLGSAQIVLVTDGLCTIDEARLTAAREAVGEIPVRVSVIAIGEENPVLQRIVAKQRAAGEVAFYQFLDGAEVGAVVEGTDNGEVPHLLDRDAARAFAIEDGGRVRDEIGALLEEIEASERATESERIAEARLESEAFAAAAMEIDFLPGPSISGVLAREEHLERDARALETRFDRWFPKDTQTSSPDKRSDADASAEVVVLAIAEVVALLGGDPLSRRADAIAMLERMLADAELDPILYGRTIEAPSEALARAIAEARRVACGPTADPGHVA